MSRQQKDPLRPLRDTERVSLVRLSRSASAPAAQVARARALLVVAEGLSYTAAAHLVGRRTGEVRNITVACRAGVWTLTASLA
jgi:hypothetical protein